MLAFFHRLKVLPLFLAALMLAESVPAAYAAQQSGDPSLDNVHFEVAGDIVRIYYDLNAPLDLVHAVRISLYRESDATFVYRPVNLTGDVGTIVFPGQKRRIIWEFTKEFPDGLVGTDYYFVVEAEAAEKEASNLWWWVGGGVAGAAALVGLIVLLSPGPGDEPPPPSGFPAPPGRPE
jgi:hypothetical protein